MLSDQILYLLNIFLTPSVSIRKQEIYCVEASIFGFTEVRSGWSFNYLTIVFTLTLCIWDPPRYPYFVSFFGIYIVNNQIKEINKYANFLLALNFICKQSKRTKKHYQTKVHNCSCDKKIAALW